MWPLVSSARPSPGISVTVTTSVMPSVTASRRSVGRSGQSVRVTRSSAGRFVHQSTTTPSATTEPPSPTAIQPRGSEWRVTATTHSGTTPSTTATASTVTVRCMPSAGKSPNPTTSEPPTAPTVLARYSRPARRPTARSAS